MGARRVNKFWFLVKCFFVILLVGLGVLVVFQKELIVEEFCNCPPCNTQEITESNSLWEDLVSEFCLCPSCD